MILVLGGCRSGKSSRALELAEGMRGENNVFVATSVPRDPEMLDRVSRHQLQRGKNWRTMECPLDLAGAIAGCGSAADVLLVDCLTLWVSNILEDQASERSVHQALDRLLDTLEQKGCPVIFVGNEVGSGVVPEHRLTRLFRDFNGLVNQRLAVRADLVIWTVAGIPVTIKEDETGGRT